MYELDLVSSGQSKPTGSTFELVEPIENCQLNSGQRTNWQPLISSTDLVDDSVTGRDPILINRGQNRELIWSRSSTIARQQMARILTKNNGGRDGKPPGLKGFSANWPTKSSETC